VKNAEKAATPSPLLSIGMSRFGKLIESIVVNKVVHCSFVIELKQMPSSCNSCPKFRASY